MNRQAAFFLCLGITACTPPGDGDDLSEDPERGEIVLSIQPYDVPSGAEMFRCEEMTLPAGRDVEIVRITSAFAPGNHHAHVYLSADGSAGGPARTYDCPQSVDFSKWHLLVGAQTAGLDWSLPEGVAIRVKARQSILVQTHSLNYTKEPQVAEGSVTLELASPGSVTRHAATIKGENKAIQVAPYTTGRVEAECVLPGDGALLAAMGHHHLHGKRFEAWMEGDEGARDVFYESDGLPEPPWVTYEDMPFSGRDRLGWACELVNNSGSPLEYGPLEATQEHCNLLAFYTREDGEAEFLSCEVEPAAPPGD